MRRSKLTMMLSLNCTLVPFLLAIYVGKFLRTSVLSTNSLNEEDILDQMLDYAANFNQPFNPTAMKAEGKTDEQELIQLRIGYSLPCLSLSL